MPPPQREVFKAKTESEWSMANGEGPRGRMLRTPPRSLSDTRKYASGNNL
jgi:hypothetical protein